MTEVDITQYPPYKMTDAQIAATVGRYQEDVVPTPAPVLDPRDLDNEIAAGRTPAAPPGVVYTGDVYNPNTAEPVRVHEAAVAAYPANVRSSVPDAVDPSTPGIKEAREALEAESYSETHAELVAQQTAAKAEDEAEAADAAAEAADEAAANGTVVPELDEAAQRKEEDADEAAAIAEAAEAVAVADPEIGQDTDNAEPAKAAPFYAEFTVAELRAELGKRGLEYEYSARKADLVAQLEEADAG